MAKGKIKFVMENIVSSVVLDNVHQTEPGLVAYDVVVTNNNFSGFIIIVVDAFSNVRQVSINDSNIGAMTYKSTEGIKHKELAVAVSLPIGTKNSTINFATVKLEPGEPIDVMATVILSRTADTKDQISSFALLNDTSVITI